MSRSFTDILLKPDAFFRDLMGEKEEFRMPIIILAIGGLVAAGYGYLIGSLTARMMSGALPGVDMIITLSAALGAFIGIFIFWFIWSGVVFLLTAAFKGNGSFKRVLQVTGYGYLPQIFGSLITLIAAFEYVPKIVVPQMSQAMMQDPEIMQQTITSMMRDPAMMELNQISTVIAIVFLLWSASIWIFGVQHARAVSTRDAALSVGIPVFIYIAYVVYTLGAV